MLFPRRPLNSLGMYAGTGPLQTLLNHPGFMEELYGFKLWQLNKAISQKLGSPSNQIQQGAVTYDIYSVDSAYEFIAGHVAARPHNAIVLQLTQTSNSAEPLEMPSFYGVRLGDRKDKVLETFKGALVEENLNDKQVFLNAETSNFSFVFTNDHLTSIRIETSEQFLDTPDTETTQNMVSELVRAVPDPTKLAEKLHPFGEVSEDEAFSILVPFSELRTKTPPELLQKLLKIGPSVKGFEPKIDMRMELHLGIGVNFKYPSPCPVEKLTFMPYNGRYCLYEAWFRKK